METINQYRHVVDRRATKIFEETLKQIIKKEKQRIRVYGIIQSPKKSTAMILMY